MVEYHFLLSLKTLFEKPYPNRRARKKFFFEYFQLKNFFSQNKFFFSKIGRFIHQNVQNEILRNFYFRK